MAQTREERNAQKREHYYKNREARLAQCREYRKKNILRIREVNKLYSQNHREQKVKYDRNRRLLKSYGITSEEYGIMFTAQGGCCAICERHQSDTGRSWLVVDHDHITGKTRSLLCDRCNVTLGALEENEQLLQAMLDYIHKYK